MDALEVLAMQREVAAVDDRVVAAAKAAVQREAAGRAGAGRVHRPRRRRAVVGVAAAVVVLAAGGVATAAATQSFFVRPIPSSELFMASARPASLPGARVRLDVAGPGGTRLEVVTDTFRTHDEVAACITLAVTDNGGRPQTADGYGGCAGTGGPAGAALPPAIPPSLLVAPWSPPSGAGYVFLYGSGMTGLARVGLIDPAGRVLVQKRADRNAWVVWAPARKLAGRDELVFIDGEGRVLAIHADSFTAGA